MFHFDRLWALRQAAEHFLTGPLSLHPIPASGEWLEAVLRLEKRAVGQDPVLSLSLYTPSHEHWPAAASSVIRRVTWDRERDREAIRYGARALKLTTSCDYFEVPSEDFDNLDRLVTNFDRALSSGGLSAGSLLRDAYGIPPRTAPLFEDPGQPGPWEQMRIERALGDCYITLEFEGKIAPDELAAGWSDLWNSLVGLTTGVPMPPGSLDEVHTVTPDDFQRSLQSFFAEANQAE